MCLARKFSLKTWKLFHEEKQNLKLRNDGKRRRGVTTIMATTSRMMIGDKNEANRKSKAFRISHDDLAKGKRSDRLTRSHLSTHLAWNSWEHGNTRSVWRGSKSQMQMTHEVWSPEWIIEQLEKVNLEGLVSRTCMCLSVEFVVWQLLYLQSP